MEGQSCIDQMVSKEPNFVVGTSKCEKCKCAVNLLIDKELTFKYFDKGKVTDFVEAVKKVKVKDELPIVYLSGNYFDCEELKKHCCPEAQKN